MKSLCVNPGFWRSKLARKYLMLRYHLTNGAKVLYKIIFGTHIYAVNFLPSPRPVNWSVHKFFSKQVLHLLQFWHCQELFILIPLHFISQCFFYCNTLQLYNRDCLLGEGEGGGYYDPGCLACQVNLKLEQGFSLTL